MALTQLPPPDDPAVFVYQDGERQGPISRRELQTKVLANEVKSNEHFWYQGMEGWESIGDHPELFDGLAPPAAAGGGTAGLETVRLSTADIAAVQQAALASRTTEDVQAAEQEAEPAAPFAAAETAFLSPADLAAAQAEVQAADSFSFEAEPAVEFEEPAIEFEEPAVEFEVEPAVEFEEPAVEFEVEPVVSFEAEPAVEFEVEPAVEFDAEPIELEAEPFAAAQTAFITPEQMAAAQAEAQGEALVSEEDVVATIDPEPVELGASATTPQTEPLTAEPEDDAFDAGSDFSFLTPSDPPLHSVHVVLDRKTGTAEITAAVKNSSSDPDDLVAMFSTGLAKIAELPETGGVKLNYEANSVVVSLTKVVAIDDAGVQAMRQLFEEAIAELRADLYKLG